MKYFSRFFAAFLFALLFATLSACAPNLVVAEVTPTEEVTAEPTATPTSSPKPSEVPTPTVDEYGFTEERRTDLNQQIQDFLSYEDGFTREKILEMLIEVDSNLDPNEIGLGIVDIQPQVQGYFFDYFEKDNRIFMLIGFDGKDGSRFVTPVEIPLYYYEGVDDMMFVILKYRVRNLDGIDYSSDDNINANGDIERTPEGNIEPIESYTRSEIITQLDNLKNKGIVLFLNCWNQDPYKIPDVDVNSKYVNDYFNEINSKVGLSLGLFQLVTSNGIPYQNIGRGDTSSIIIIDDVNNVGNIDISKVPILMIISFFAGNG